VTKLPQERSTLTGAEGSKPPLLKYLEDRGVTLKDLVEAALELFVPHPGVEGKQKATEVIIE